MELQGEIAINAPRDRVWAALNDPAVLARCIDGVESLVAEGDNRFVGTLNAKVGPVKAKFSGHVELTELDPPNRYVLVGEGKGGVAGFAKGSAEVTLADAAGGGTTLSYVARSQVGGKLAQLGTRLIEGTARGYAESFFAALKSEVEGPVPQPVAEPEEALVEAPVVAAVRDAAEIRAAGVAAATDAVTSPTRGLPPVVWISGLVLLVIAVTAMLLN